MTDQTQTPDSAPRPPQPGEFCHRHFSWLCQANQGACQREAATSRQRAPR